MHVTCSRCNGKGYLVGRDPNHGRVEWLCPCCHGERTLPVLPPNAKPLGATEWKDYR